MNLQLNDLLQNGWLLGLVCCVVPFVVILAAAFWVMRNAPRLIQPDLDELRRDFEKLRAQHPNQTTDQLVNRIISRQAFRSGLIGAITSVGGLPLLPFGLTIDLYTSSRLQSAMLQFIAWAYQPPSSAAVVRSTALDMTEALALRFGVTPNDLLVLGGQRLSRYALRQLVVNVVEKSFAKLIPGIGLVIGFIVNYSITRGMGYVAARYHAARRGTLPPMGTAR